MLRQLPESRLAILDLLRFPLPPSLLPTFPLFLNSLSSFINTSDPGDVEKSKNREWRNIVFFLNFPTPPQEKPTTRHQHSTLNAPLSLSRLPIERYFNPNVTINPDFRGDRFSPIEEILLRSRFHLFPTVLHARSRNVRA